MAVSEIRWQRVSSGHLRSKCGNFEVWLTCAIDGSQTWNARAYRETGWNLGYFVTAKAWCELRRK